MYNLDYDLFEKDDKFVFKAKNLCRAQRIFSL